MTGIAAAGDRCRNATARKPPARIGRSDERFASRLRRVSGGGSRNRTGRYPRGKRVALATGTLSLILYVTLRRTSKIRRGQMHGRRSPLAHDCGYRYSDRIAVRMTRRATSTSFTFPLA
jgi:hypothetical protein